MMSTESIADNLGNKKLDAGIDDRLHGKKYGSSGMIAELIEKDPLRNRS